MKFAAAATLAFAASASAFAPAPAANVSSEDRGENFVFLEGFAGGL